MKKTAAAPVIPSVVIIVFCTIFAAGMTGVLLMTASDDKQSEMSTVELNDTIEAVRISDTGKDVYVQIIIKGNGATLQIPTSVCNEINVAPISAWKKGQEILFRIEKDSLAAFEKEGFAIILSLRTPDSEVFSLTDYNRLTHAAIVPARITAIIIVTLLLAVIYIVFRRKNETEQSNDN